MVSSLPQVPIHWLHSMADPILWPFGALGVTCFLKWQQRSIFIPFVQFWNLCGACSSFEDGF